MAGGNKREGSSFDRRLSSSVRGQLFGINKNVLTVKFALVLDSLYYGDF